MAALWLFLVVLGAPLLHAPVPRWDLLHALQCPLDGGRTLRGRRLLGDNKTWRGALCMIVGVVLATLVLWRWEWWRAQRPAAVRGSSPLLVGCLVGLGTVGGELRNSFPSAGWTSLRVRDGARPPGWRSPCSTSADLVLGIWVALLPVWTMPVWLQRSPSPARRDPRSDQRDRPRDRGAHGTG